LNGDSIWFTVLTKSLVDHCQPTSQVRHIFPQNRQAWLSFVLLPFKAYTVIAPVLLLISENLPRPRHLGATDAEMFLVIGLIPCGAFLLFAALLLFLSDKIGYARPCLGFGVAALIMGYYFLPTLASA
jgi:hypothetical protein